jgi:hypothetical protein
MEVIAVEAATVYPANIAPPATALKTLTTATALETLTTAAATVSLHKNKPAIVGLNRSVGRSYVAVRCERYHRPCSGAAHERQDGHEQH